MQAVSGFRKSFHGTALRSASPGLPIRDSTRPLGVWAYKKGSGKPKGGYGGTEPNAKKGFCKVDSSGRKSKGLGAYRFTKKYGDVNDYSPIYDPYTWSQGGEVYALGTRGLTAWGGLLAIGLALSVYLVVSTSQLGY